MIKTQGLTKRYSNDFCALDRLDLEIGPGEVYGFIGPNGAGKTTTIRILCGLLLPTEGAATVGGHDVTRHRATIQQLTGYLPDDFGVYEEMRVWEYLDFFGACFKIPPKRRRARIDEVLEVTGSAAMRDYFVDTLSRGMHQRIGIAKTLMHDPKVVFLDEPANGLDPRARMDMRDLIRRLADMGKTLLVSSHILPELAVVCDRVGIIERGVLLADGTVEEIMRRVSPNRRVMLEFIGDAPHALAVAQAMARQGAIQKPDLAGTVLQFEMSGTEGDVAAMLERFIELGVKVVWFREDEGDLEEAFLRVTDGAAAGARAAAAAEKKK